MGKKETGLVSVSFRDKSPEEILAAMQKASLKHIEWGSDVHAPYQEAEKLSRIAEMQKKYGIKCSSYGTYFTLGVTDLSELEGYIEAAKVLGTDILRLWCGNKRADAYENEARDILFSSCRKAAEIAEKHNVTLCMECHPNTYTETKEGAFALMQAVNHTHFRMYWQPNQFETFAENMAYLSLLNPYIKHVHVFQWKERERFSLSEGIGVWRSYLSRMEGDHMLLLEFMPDNQIESLSGEADHLRKILEGIQ